MLGRPRAAPACTMAWWTEFPASERRQVVRTSILIAAIVAALSAVTQPAHGLTWGPEWRITNNAVDDLTGLSNGRNVVADGNGGVHVVWTQGTTVRYSRSTNGGETWTADVVLSTSNARWPSMVLCPNGDIVVVYAEDNADKSVYTRRSTDGGASWGVADYVWDTSDQVTGTWSVGPPVIAVAPDGTPYVVAGWRQYFGYYRYILKSFHWHTLGFWVTGGDLADLNGSSDYTPPYGPGLAADHENNLHLAYNNLQTSVQVAYRKRTGGTWGATQLIAGTSPGTSSVSIAVDVAANPYVVWTHSTANNVRMSCYSGSSWNTVEVATGGANAQVIAADGDIHVVWSEDNRIRYRRWNVGAGAWNADAADLTDGTYDADYPSLAEGGLHLVWQDARGSGGTKEVIYKEIAEGGEPELVDFDLTAPANDATGLPTDGIAFEWEDASPVDALSYELYMVEARATRALRWRSRSTSPRTAGRMIWQILITAPSTTGT